MVAEGGWNAETINLASVLWTGFVRLHRIVRGITIIRSREEKGGSSGGQTEWA